MISHGVKSREKNIIRIFKGYRLERSSYETGFYYRQRRRGKDDCGPGVDEKNGVEVVSQPHDDRAGA